MSYCLIGESKIHFCGLKSKVAVKVDMALRWARYFSMSPQFWLGLQMDYDLDVEEDRLAKRLEREVRTYASAA